MSILSLDSIFQSTRSTLTRFPLAVAAVLLGMVACFYTIHLDGQSVSSDQYHKLAFICNIAFVALLAADLYAESNDWMRLKKWVLRLLVVLFCTALYFSLQPEIYSADRFRIGFFIIAFHLGVSYSAFLHHGTLNGFWEFNKILLLRILTAGFYAAVLFAGLSIAMLAIDQLFNVVIDGKVYLYLLTITGIGFTTFYFMAGIPSAFKALNTTEPVYPKGLKVFTQYVLLPLMVIYLAILLVYEVSILISWELPKGTVSMLILSYAVVGLLSVLLIYPIKERTENHWFKQFSRFFFIMMIPLLVLLMLAIWERIRHYGITEPRYILIVLAIWLTIITAYFLWSAKQNIRIIPVSLSVLAFLSAFGPQSAPSVSRYSQLQRFKHYQAAKDDEGMLEKRRIIQYLVNYHGLTTLQPFTSVDLQEVEHSINNDTVSSASRYAMETKRVDTAYKLFKVDHPSLEMKGGQLHFAVDKKTPLSVKGYDYLVPINDTVPIDLLVNGLPVAIRQEHKGSITLKIGQEPLMLIDLKRVVKETELAYRQGKLKPKQSEAYYLLPGNGMSQALNTDQYEVKLVVTELFLFSPANRKDDFNFMGYLMIKIK